jgi:hypothetical protein
MDAPGAAFQDQTLPASEKGGLLTCWPPVDGEPQTAQSDVQGIGNEHPSDSTHHRASFGRCSSHRVRACQFPLVASRSSCSADWRLRSVTGCDGSPTIAPETISDLGVGGLDAAVWVFILGSVGRFAGRRPWSDCSRRDVVADLAGQHRCSNETAEQAINNLTSAIGRCSTQPASRKPAPDVRRLSRKPTARVARGRARPRRRPCSS